MNTKATLRLVSRLIAMVGLLAPYVVLLHLWKVLHKQTPNPWPRRFLSQISRIAGVRIRTIGRRAPGQLLMLANHLGWIDVAGLAAITGTTFVAQDGLADITVVRWLCAMNDTIFIARHDRTGIGTQIAALRAALADKQTVTLFPEGTTSDGSGLLPFKSALLAALDPHLDGLTVQPIWLDYGRHAGATAWIGEERGWDNFTRILGRAEPVELTIHFLEPLAGPALATRKAMVAAARQAILAAMAPVALQNAALLP